MTVGIRDAREARLPLFNEHGLLLPGTYPLTFDQLRASFLVHGRFPGASRKWDSNWRAQLANNAESLVQELWRVGIQDVYLDGSFVEAKDHPNDVDGYFECSPRAFVEIRRRLNLINPYKVWTWDTSERRPDPGSMIAKLPMWHRYRVEFYVHFPGTGVPDEYGNERILPSLFRKQRDTQLQKGILRMIEEWILI